MILRMRIHLIAPVAVIILVGAAITRGQQPAENAGLRVQVDRTISGRLISSAGEPLSGGTVYASSLANARLSRSVRVSSDGSFKIDGLDPGPYRIWSALPGYVSTELQRPTDAATFYRPGDSITLSMVKGGVITGTVTGPNGPLVALGVYALRVRDESGKPVRTTSIFRERLTDDRGVYRLYGLPPGSYLVRVARPRSGLVAPSAYDSDVPTYFPSSTRAAAAEIVVREGEEISADIQHRSEAGHTIRGNILGVTETQSQFRASVTVTLTHLQTGTEVGSVGTNPFVNMTFAIQGVPDGEYELNAIQFLQTRASLRSKPRRVTVRGNDIGDITLTLAAQASIEGRLVFERNILAGCAKRREFAAQETILYARRFEPDQKKAGSPPADVPATLVNLVSLAVGDGNGTFTFRNLPPGSYRIDPRPPASGWYLRSVNLSQRQNAISRSAADSFSVKAGEKVSGLTVTFAEGAAVVRGRIAPVENQNLPSLRLYLVPAEKDSGTNPLRYFESEVGADGSFAIGNIVPGEYLVVALPTDADGQPGGSIRADSVLRTAVLRESDKSKQALALKPCERIDKYELRYPATTKP